MGAGRDNSVPFIRQNGPVQKLQYPDNPRDARSRKRQRGERRGRVGSGTSGGRMKKTAAGSKVRVDTRVPSRRGKCAVEIEELRRAG